MTPGEGSTTGRPAEGGEEHPSLAHLVAGPLPDGFTRSVVTICVGGSVSCPGTGWGQALVIVDRGALEVETSDGSRTPFPTGAVLAVAELTAGRLHNGGTEPVRLVAVRRSSATGNPPPAAVPRPIRDDATGLQRYGQ
jgi:hypothetical protein